MDHEEVKEICGGTVPFNFDELHYDTDDTTGDALIECNDCDGAYPENEWGWINTTASQREKTREMEVHAVYMECPNCENVSVFR